VRTATQLANTPGQLLKASCASYAEGLAPPALCLEPEINIAFQKKRFFFRWALLKYPLQMSQSTIFQIIRLQFFYADNSSELCWVMP
jgi:hypothetical protein